MHPRQPVPEAITQLAIAQGGALTLAQCRMAGMGLEPVRRLVREGSWAMAGRGLLVTTPGLESLHTRRWLGILAAGDGAALALQTAAAMIGWGRPTDEVYLVVPASHRRVQPGPWTVMRTRVPFTTRGLLPVTTPERTVLDMVRRDPPQAVGLLTDVVNARCTTPAKILRELEKFDAFPRRAFVRGLLGDVGGGALSVLEVMWLREVERAHGLPRGERQSRSRAGHRDIRYGRLLVELDGRLGHTGRGAFRDMDRDNIHVLQGELTLRFGFHDVDRRPCAAAAMVALALRRLGMHVDPVSCPRGCVETESLLDRSA